MAPIEVVHKPLSRVVVAARRDEAWLCERLGKGVHSVVLTRNRTRIISAKPSGDGGLHVRTHRCFLQADDLVLDALAEFLHSRRKDRRSSALVLLRDFFQKALGEEPPPRRRLRLASEGRHHDLAAIRDAINHEYFDGQVEVAITWGRGAATRAKRRRQRGFSLRLGSYHDADRLVRIHPALDHPDVPHFVVAAVVHHEMVHAVVPTHTHNGRRRIHTPEFRHLERRYRHYQEAEDWLQSHVESLVRRR